MFLSHWFFISPSHSSVRILRGVGAIFCSIWHFSDCPFELLVTFGDKVIVITVQCLTDNSVCVCCHSISRHFEPGSICQECTSPRLIHKG